MHHRITLIPSHGAGLQPVELVDGTYVLGRQEVCDVRLPHESVSRQHAQLELKDGHWVLTDLESTHGTYIGEDRLKPGESHTLSPGIRLAIGPYCFTIQIEVDGRVVPPPTTDPYVTDAKMIEGLRDPQTMIREARWSDFCQRYQKVIAGYARNMGLKGSDIDDAIQDVMTRFLRNVGFEYDRSKGRFRGYLKTITRQVVGDIARRNQRHPQMPENAEFGGPMDEDALFEQQMEAFEMEAAFAAIKPNYDEVTIRAYELYALRAVPAEEVARQLDLKLNSVHSARSRIARAIAEEIERRRAEEDG